MGLFKKITKSVRKGVKGAQGGVRLGVQGGVRLGAKVTKQLPPYRVGAAIGSVARGNKPRLANVFRVFGAKASRKGSQLPERRKEMRKMMRTRLRGVQRQPTASSSTSKSPASRTASSSVSRSPIRQGAAKVIARKLRKM